MDLRAGEHGDIRPHRERCFLREPQCDLQRNPKWDSDEDSRGDFRGDSDRDWGADSRMALRGSRRGTFTPAGLYLLSQFWTIPPYTAWM